MWTENRSRYDRSQLHYASNLTHVLSTGCQWAALPKDLVPRSTVNYFNYWDHDHMLDRLRHALYVQCRE